LPLMPFAFTVLLGLAATVCGGVPPMEVTVFDANSKVAFKGPITANATFTTQELAPGNYVVQFNAKSAAAKNGEFLVVVSAGNKKVIASAVPGQKFMAGGVAIKVELGTNAR